MKYIKTVSVRLANREPSRNNVILQIVYHVERI